MSELFLGRIEKVQLTADDYVLISDAVGGRIKTTTIGACAVGFWVGGTL